MKRFTAWGCAALTFVSSNVPLAVLAGHEEHHAAPAHHEAPHPAAHREAPHPAAHREAPHPAAHREAPHPADHREAPHPAPHPEASRPDAGRPRGEQRNEAKPQSLPENRSRDVRTGEPRQQEKMNERDQRPAGERKSDVRSQEPERKEQEHEAKEQEKAQKEQERAQKEQEKEQEKAAKEQAKEQEKQLKEERKAEERQGKSGSESNLNAGERNQERFDQAGMRRDEPEQHGFNREGFNHGRLRPTTLSPLHAHRIPLSQASPPPYLQGHLNAEQRMQAEMAQQNMEHHLYAINANQAPSGYQNYGSAQINNYLNSNYPTTINNQTYWINSGNTYCNPYAGGWPRWYQPIPGWNFTTGLVLGSIAAGLNWLRWGWPHYYGRPPAGFIYQNGYAPTPWIYVPWANQWRQPGVMGYASAPPPQDYTMPITVQVVEPVQTTMTDPNTGDTEPTTINQVVMYNAYYYPQFGRWGYMNRQGYFVWVDPSADQPGAIAPPVVPGSPE